MGKSIYGNKTTSHVPLNHLSRSQLLYILPNVAFHHHEVAMDDIKTKVITRCDALRFCNMLLTLKTNIHSYHYLDLSAGC